MDERTMAAAILAWLKRRIAGPELRLLERYRVATELAETWNSMIPASAKTAQWIREVGEGRRAYDPERLRKELGGP